MIYVILLVVEFENCPLTYALFFQNFCCNLRVENQKYIGFTQVKLLLKLFYLITGKLFINVKL